MLRLENTLKGQVPFQKLPVNLTGDSEGQRDQHSAKLLKRLAKDLDLVMFASKRGKRYTAFGYTNGTWFQMIAQAEEDPAKVRWGLTHCEPYLRRTFKGTTETLKQVVQDGLANKKKPPEPDANEPPGLGPEIKEEKTKDKQAGGGLSSGLSTEYAGRLTQYSAPSTQYAVLSTQYSVLGTQYSVLSTRKSSSSAAPADAPEEPAPPRAFDPARILEEEDGGDRRPAPSAQPAPSADDIVRVRVDLYLPGGIRPELRAKLVAFVGEGKPAGPALARRVREAVHAIVTMAEYHLA
jgi:hypothetical protein